jgi:hypothetical protein
MTTRKQKAANQTNAKKSTGPKTEEGKARSKMNAETHGLTSECPVMIGEDEEEYEKLQEILYREFQPQSWYDRLRIDDLADLLWRLRRIPHMEGDILFYAQTEVQHRIARSKATDADLEEHGFEDPLNTSATPETKNLKLRAKVAKMQAQACEDNLGGAYLYDVKNGDSISKLGRHEVRIRNAVDKLIAQLDQRREKRTQGGPPYDEGARRAYGLNGNSDTEGEEEGDEV